MIYLDEEVAKIQKTMQLVEAYKKVLEEKMNIQSEEIVIEDKSQEEVTLGIKEGILEYKDRVLGFERTSFFENKLSMPLIKDFFEIKEDIPENIHLVGKEEFLITLSFIKEELEVANRSQEEMQKDIMNAYKEMGFYLEILQSEEVQLQSTTKKIVSFRIATSKGYITIYQLLLINKGTVIAINFICLDKKKEVWEKVIKGMAELIEVSWGEEIENE